METDPARRLKEFRLPCSAPMPSPRPSRIAFRECGCAICCWRKQANAFERLGEYEQAVPLFQQSPCDQPTYRRQDAKDFRALFDVVTVLDDEAKEL